MGFVILHTSNYEAFLTVVIVQLAEKLGPFEIGFVCGQKQKIQFSSNFASYTTPCFPLRMRLVWLSVAVTVTIKSSKRREITCDVAFLINTPMFGYTKPIFLGQFNVSYCSLQRCKSTIVLVSRVSITRWCMAMEPFSIEARARDSQVASVITATPCTMCHGWWKK